MPRTDGRVPVWDAAVRLLHWSLAALVLFNGVRDDGDFVHRVIGYAAVGVVGARLLWAAVASGAAAWSELTLSMPGTLRYLRRLLRGNVARHLGHNPLGRWMVWLLWSLVLLLGLTGWLSRTDALWGEDWPRDVHALLAKLLWVAVALHLAGVALMSWLQRENLPLAMITGSKRAPSQDGT
ncbi:cytochrome b/b6 domain-containing protein [Ideonella sp. BN130291]|uniref:cytochrome b/b6 domain-containing protein n=1 Tax=Ideonella sp. BN130291 TaxID=3112940 RepID=UPI002E25A73C|nr:cytochrome b/b6 domain-containing protein [Ideonella sp. BN130291]